MPGLALAVIAIALPDSLNPSLIVAAIYLALGPHGVRRTLTFTLAAFVVTLAGGILVALGLGDLVVAHLPKLSPTVKADLMIGAGMVLCVGGVVIWWRRVSLADSEPPSRGDRPPPGSPIVLGAAIAGVEFLTAFPYFAAIAMIVGSSVHASGKALLLIVYNIIYVLPLIAIVVVHAVMGGRARGVLAPAGDWVAMRWPVVVAPTFGVVGVGLAVYGIVQLR